jgi:hypothetical protein
LSRHRIISRKQNKLIIVAAAGTLTVVIAASAAAAASPSGSAPASGAPSGAVFSAITTRSGQTAAGRGTQQSHRAARRFRVIADLQAMATMLAPQQAAAHQAAVAQAAVAQAAKRRAQAALTAKREAARKAAQQAPAQQRSGQQLSGQQQAASSAPTASGSPRSIAQAMLGSFGWSASQFSCLGPLWADESGWSATASNPSTGAYGIPQAMPASKMASAGPNWQTSAATQIRWGLDYIKSTYGSPCAAWSHEEADGWY